MIISTPLTRLFPLITPEFPQVFNACNKGGIDLTRSPRIWPLESPRRTRVVGGEAVNDTHCGEEEVAGGSTRAAMTSFARVSIQWGRDDPTMGPRVQSRERTPIRGLAEGSSNEITSHARLGPSARVKGEGWRDRRVENRRPEWKG